MRAGHHIRLGEVKGVVSVEQCLVDRGEDVDRFGPSDVAEILVSKSTFSAIRERELQSRPAPNRPTPLPARDRSLHDGPPIAVNPGQRRYTADADPE